MDALSGPGAVFAAASDAAGAAVEQLLKRLGRCARSKFPFGNPISIEQRHVDIAVHMPYWVAEKTDGVRVCLLFTRTRTPEREECCVLMDRMGRLFGVPIKCDAALFDGSLFDAELVARPAPYNDYVVLVFDVACVDGDADAGTDALSVRLQTIAATFPSLATFDGEADRDSCDDAAACSSDPDAALTLHGQAVQALTDRGYAACTHANVRILAKSMRRLGDVADQDEVLAQRCWASDGFVLTPDLEPASAPGTAWSTYKVKAAHTMDLLWDGLALWYGSAEEMLRVDTLQVEGCSAKVVVAPDFPTNHPCGTILEVLPLLRADGDVQLSFVATRRDRDVPNNAVCVAGTLASVRDSITLNSILERRRQRT